MPPEPEMKTYSNPFLNAVKKIKLNKKKKLIMFLFIDNVPNIESGYFPMCRIYSRKLRCMPYSYYWLRFINFCRNKVIKGIVAVP